MQFLDESLADREMSENGEILIAASEIMTEFLNLKNYKGVFYLILKSQKQRKLDKKIETILNETVE